MAENESDQRVTDLLVQESRDAADRIHTLMLADERLMATGVSLLGLAASVAIAKGKSYLLVGLPYAMATLFCFVEFMHLGAVALGGYKATLEEAIAARVRNPVIAWESHVAKQIHRAKTGWATRILIGLAYCASVVLALIEALRARTPRHWGSSHAPLLITLTSVSIAIGTIAIGFVLWGVSHEFDRVRALTRAQLYPNWVLSEDASGAEMTLRDTALDE
jgi:hypothetical protein